MVLRATTPLALSGTPMSVNDIRFRLLVTGSRDWPDKLMVEKTLDELVAFGMRLSHAGDVVIVHGACPRGGDKMADDWALESGFAVEQYRANWNALGRSAGFIRNKQMVDLGADLCIAFIYNKSRGASSCADLAHRALIPVVRFIL